MELSFIKVNPTQNTTILIETPVLRSAQPAVAAALMSPGHVGGEQVGFIEPATLPGCRARLQMMGGEFCGNAAMSLAAFLADRDELPDGELFLEVSGCDSPVLCTLERRNGGFLGAVNMPLPQKITEAEDLPAVFFPGIVHLIAPAERYSDVDAQKFVRSYCRRNKLEAVGLMLISENGHFMRPCVYVADTDSTTWERGCASGSAALGAWLCLSKGITESSIAQPGGTIKVLCEARNNAVTALTIIGHVAITAKGTAYI